MRIEDELVNYTAEDIRVLLRRTYENNILKFVVLFGEDGYLLGGMRNGDEGPGRTLDEMIKKIPPYKDKSLIEKMFRLQDNSKYFYGIIKCIKVKGTSYYRFGVSLPKDGITINEFINYHKFLVDNKSLINEDCLIRLGQIPYTISKLNKKIATSISKNRAGKVFFEGSKLQPSKKLTLKNFKQKKFTNKSA